MKTPTREEVHEALSANGWKSPMINRWHHPQFGGESFTLKEAIALNASLFGPLFPTLGELEVKHPDSELIDYLASMWDSQGKGHHMMGRHFLNVTGSFRDAVKARMHHSNQP